MSLFSLVMAPFSAYSSVMKTRKDLVAVLGIGLLAACGGKPASVGPSGDGGGAERAGEITVVKSFLVV